MSKIVQLGPDQRSYQAILLLSGGLDSTLALKMMLDQNIKVLALNFYTVFCNCNRKERGTCRNEAYNVCKTFNTDLKRIDVSEEYIHMIKNPRYKYGRGMNPCIDCRIFMHRKAKKVMEEVGAEFVVTGEVLGQRPMSQYKKALKIIEKESGLQGRIVRPLSAHLLEPTIPEETGLVDRDRLEGIQGRSRKAQIKLAEETGVTDYLCPAGGCLLTEKTFSNKLKDYLRYNPKIDLRDIVALKFGRHLRLSSNTKLIIGRNESENKWLSTYGAEMPMFEVEDYPGPVAVVSGKFLLSDIELISSLTAGYSDVKNLKNVKVRYKYQKDVGSANVIPATQIMKEKYLIL